MFYTPANIGQYPFKTVLPSMISAKLQINDINRACSLT